MDADEPLKLQVFIDKSVVEVFANDRQAVMRRIYSTRDDEGKARLAVRNLTWPDDWPVAAETDFFQTRL